MPNHLPDHPNLEQLKKQAKSLLRAARAREAAALDRFRVLPAFAASPGADCRHRDLALHDAQSVIAREHGFASWQALRDEVEARTLTFAAAVDEFVRCATGGAPGRARTAARPAPGHRHRVAADGARARRCRRRPRAARARPRPGDAARRSAATGSRCSTPATRRCTGSEPARVGGLVDDRPRAVRARRRTRTPSTTGTGTRNCRARRCGRRSASIRHLPLAEVLLDAGAEPDRRRVGCTSRAAAATSPRSSCCAATAST